MKNVITILVVLLLTAAGAYLFARYDERMTEVAQDSLSWPSVTGLVTRSELRATSQKRGKQRTTEHRIDVSFEYIVDDEMYENDVIQFNQGALSVSDKRLLVSTYPEGRKVEVFYNPRKPDQSVLVPGSYP